VRERERERGREMPIGRDKEMRPRDRERRVGTEREVRGKSGGPVAVSDETVTPNPPSHDPVTENP